MMRWASNTCYTQGCHKQAGMVMATASLSLRITNVQCDVPPPRAVIVHTEVWACLSCLGVGLSINQSTYPYVCPTCAGVTTPRCLTDPPIELYHPIERMRLQIPKWEQTSNNRSISLCVSIYQQKMGVYISMCICIYTHIHYLSLSLSLCTRGRRVESGGPKLRERERKREREREGGRERERAGETAGD